MITLHVECRLEVDDGGAWHDHTGLKKGSLGGSHRVIMAGPTKKRMKEKNREKKKVKWQSGNPKPGV